MVCAIIGAGQLGSRHLQGLLKFDQFNLSIYVIDKSKQSLHIAKSRQMEVEHCHEVTFTQNLELLPEKIDFVVLATSSNVREEIALVLLSNFIIKYLILEKVLFPDLEAYKNVKKALQGSKTKCFVNHPRRMYSSYKNLKERLRAGTLFFQVVGSNWGLACNGLHFIDLFSFLLGSDPVFLDCSGLDSRVIKSKRVGYIEVLGTIRGKLENGSEFMLHSANEELVLPAISITGIEQRFHIQESSTPLIFSFDARSHYDPVRSVFNMEYQSDLTHQILLELIETGASSLTGYEESARAHTLFIQNILEHYNNINNTSLKSLPIT
ncbi:MAG: Gfo/Idh/MocA family oxidoreductase [Bacteroidota bacterium]